MRCALPLLALAAAAPAADAPVAVAAPVFVEDFEAHAAGAPPGAPWKMTIAGNGPSPLGLRIAAAT